MTKKKECMSAAGTFAGDEPYVWENAPAPVAAEKVIDNLRAFDFNGLPVRAKVIDNEPWFVAKDVADVLGYSETNRMTARLDDDETISTKLVGMNMKSTLINESGLYNAILGSNKPEAKAFKKWVTGEVLPAIRKTGKYEVPADPMAAALASMEWMRGEIERKRLQIEEQTAQIARLSPDADYTRKVLSADSLCSVNAIGAHLGVSAIKLNQFLIAEKWIYRQGKTIYPSAVIRDKGYCDFHVVPYAYDEQGNVKTHEHLKWTEAGRRAVIELWNKRHCAEAL